MRPTFWRILSLVFFLKCSAFSNYEGQAYKVGWEMRFSKCDSCILIKALWIKTFSEKNNFEFFCISSWSFWSCASFKGSLDKQHELWIRISRPIIRALISTLSNFVQRSTLRFTPLETQAVNIPLTSFS